jgi:hypothetical protein
LLRFPQLLQTLVLKSRECAPGMKNCSVRLVSKSTQCLDRCQNLLNAVDDFHKMVLPISQGGGGLRCHMHDQVHWYHYHHSNFHCTTQSMVMSYLSHSIMSNITRSATSNKSSSSSSSAASTVGVAPPAIPNSIKDVVGAAAFL